VTTASLEAGSLPRGQSRGRLWPRVSAPGLLPFALYFVVFLGVPTVAVLVGAFQGAHGGFTTQNLSTAFSGTYLRGYWTTIRLALISSIIPGVLGFVIAYAVHLSGERNWLRRTVTSVSGVFANFGGVFLAFLFTSTYGRVGLVTHWLGSLGYHLDTTFLYRLSGVELVYGYFQIPLMVLVITPALGALRPAWREASDNLGAGSWDYWRLVGGPVLLPAFLGAVLLLFGSAMSAYATADALTSGSLPITSIQISQFVNGNVVAGQENVGKAISLGLVVIVAVVMAVYALLQRRASTWLR
jgi:putative spermidine/putrescine transport system permease protein